MDPELDERTRRLLGDEAAERLSSLHILVAGVGGVGGYAAEILCRAGVGRLSFIDADRFAPSNRNRQLHALASNGGEYKAECVARRCRDINPGGSFDGAVRRITPENAGELLAEFAPDGVIDAIDDVPAKCALLLAAFRAGIPLVSSMGAGAKLDPGRIAVADLGRSSGCPLARAVRSRLRCAGVTKGIPCVYSPEPRVLRHGAAGFGTVSYMPALFGIRAAAELLRRLLAAKPERPSAGA